MRAAREEKLFGSTEVCGTSISTQQTTSANSDVLLPTKCPSCKRLVVYGCLEDDRCGDSHSGAGRIG